MAFHVSHMWLLSEITNKFQKKLKFDLAIDDRYVIMKNMNDKIAQIDIEIEACERAIRKAYCVQEADSLQIRVQDLIKQRFVAFNLKGKINNE